ncbi:MAG: sensor histidine kinase, partial [Pedobacter sp.]
MLKPSNLFSLFQTQLTYLCLASCVLFFSCKKDIVEDGIDPVKFEKFYDNATKLVEAGKSNQAIDYIDAIYKTHRNFSATQHWHKHHFKFNTQLNKLSNTQLAKLALDSMYLLIEKSRETYPMEYTNTLFSNGNLMIALKNYDGGIKKYYEGESFASKHLDACELTGFTGKIAYFFYRQKKYPEAIKYLKKALEGNKACTNETDFSKYFIDPQGYLNSIGLSYERMGMLDSAILFYKKSIATINTRKVKFKEKEDFAQLALGVVYGNLGGTYLLKGENILAESLLKESIKINSRSDFAPLDAYTAKFKLARLLINTNRPNEASVILKDFMLELKRQEQPYNAVVHQLRLSAKELNWRLQDKNGQIEAAYNAFKTYTLLKDSLASEEKNLGQKDLESVFKLAQNQYELTLLEDNKKLTTFYMWGAIILAALLTLILTLIITYLKRYKKHNLELKKLHQTLVDKNLKLETTLDELQKSYEDNYRMMKIIYHDLRSPIGGMTMAIGLMLEDEHHTAEDREMLQMINTSGQDAIGLINDMLQINTDVELNKELIKVDDLLQYSGSMLQFKAEEKGQKIITRGEKIDILVDQEKIRRVLNNLLSNAVKFSPFESKIVLSSQLKGNDILISCEDFGIGVPEDQLET